MRSPRVHRCRRYARYAGACNRRVGEGYLGFGHLTTQSGGVVEDHAIW